MKTRAIAIPNVAACALFFLLPAQSNAVVSPYAHARVDSGNAVRGALDVDQPCILAFGGLGLRPATGERARYTPVLSLTTAHVELDQRGKCGQRHWVIPANELIAALQR